MTEKTHPSRHQSAVKGSEDEDTAPDQVQFSRQALALKQAGASDTDQIGDTGGALHPKDPTASEGKGPMEDQARRVAPSGAFEDVGDLPSRERSRTRY